MAESSWAQAPVARPDGCREPESQRCPVWRSSAARRMCEALVTRNTRFAGSAAKSPVVLRAFSNVVLDWSSRVMSVAGTPSRTKKSRIAAAMLMPGLLELSVPPETMIRQPAADRAEGPEDSERWFRRRDGASFRPDPRRESCRRARQLRRPATAPRRTAGKTIRGCRGPGGRRSWWKGATAAAGQRDRDR